MTKLHPRSYTSIKMFGQCPFKYKAMVIDKSVPFTTTDAQQAGIDIHAALEDAVKNGTKLPAKFAEYQAVADTIIAMPGVKYCEKKLAISNNVEACDYFAPDIWYRGIIDVLVHNGTTARLFDYKHGNSDYQDDDQLRENALLIFANLPEVDTITASFIYLDEGKVTKPLVIKREDMRVLIVRLSKKEVPVLRAEKLNSFPENKSHLCNYCQVTTCRYHNRG